MGKLFEVMARNFGADPTPRDFIEAAYGLRNETAGGILPPITYQRDQGHGATDQCVIPIRVQNQQFVPASDDFSCAPGWKPVGQ